MKLVAYLRVSTEKQAEEGLGLDVQEKAIRAYAKAEGHKVVAIHADEGVSGAKPSEDRPGLMAALTALKERRGAGMVVYRLDRLARDLILQERLLAEVQRLGAKLLTTVASESDYLEDDPNDPSRRLIRQVLGSVNEYERSMIALRLRSGRKLKADRGGYAYGAPPFGFRAEDGALVADQRETAALKRLLDLHGEGLSLRSIASVLTEEGHQTKRGGRWHPATVARAIGRSALTPG